MKQGYAERAFRLCFRKRNKNWFKWRKPQVFNLSFYIAKRKGREMNARPLITKIFFVCGYAEMWQLLFSLTCCHACCGRFFLTIRAVCAIKIPPPLWWRRFAFYSGLFSWRSVFLVKRKRSMPSKTRRQSLGSGVFKISTDTSARKTPATTSRK